MPFSRCALFGATLLTMALGCAPRPTAAARSAASEAEAQEERRCHRVIRALEAETRVALHVGSVSHEELARVIGAEGAAEALKHRVILRVRYETGGPVTPSDARDVRLLTRRTPTSWPAGLTPLELTRERLAYLTGELLPQTTTTETPSTATTTKQSRFDKALSNGPPGIAAGFLELITLGILPATNLFPDKEVTTPGNPRSVSVVEPTEADYLREAPMAEQLFRALQGDRTAGAPLLFERPHGGHITIRVRIGYNSMRPEETCRLLRIIEIPLPDGDSLEERIEKRFGAAMYPLYGAPPEAEDAAPEIPATQEQMADPPASDTP
jgi:hypothetical protein